ncbi:MAG: aminoacyl-tRNA hydrolase [Oscillospiraceae bacterium]|nr:aminoacyl-tRNA hydrolase [Oscillospiraceae bacterium]
MADLSALFDLIGKSSKPAATGPVEYMVVCLGNPGKQYENTRHNVGFITADVIAEKRGFKIDKLRFQSLTGECMIAGKRVLFIKPSTFMNLSGQAVVEAMNFHKLPIENVIVVHDDVSLAPGRLRLRAKGSHGGHNGLRNIIYLTGKDTFPRVKIGVGDKPHPDYDMADWVLAVPAAEDRKLIEQAILKIDDIIELFVSGKFNEAMNRYNGK